MKEIINSQSIDELKKSRRISILSIVISLVITGGLMVPLFLYASRSNRTLFTILLTALATIDASFILYLFVVSIVPLNDYIKVSNFSIGGNKYLTKGRIINIDEKVSHYKGVAVRKMRVSDLEEENKEYYFFVEQNLVDLFKQDKSYSFITYQSFITSYEEIL